MSVTAKFLIGLAKKMVKTSALVQLPRSVSSASIAIGFLFDSDTMVNLLLPVYVLQLYGSIANL